MPAGTSYNFHNTPCLISFQFANFKIELSLLPSSWMDLMNKKLEGGKEDGKGVDRWVLGYSIVMDEMQSHEWVEYTLKFECREKEGDEIRDGPP